MAQINQSPFTYLILVVFGLYLLNSKFNFLGAVTTYTDYHLGSQAYLNHTFSFTCTPHQTGTSQQWCSVDDTDKLIFRSYSKCTLGDLCDNSEDVEVVLSSIDLRTVKKLTLITNAEVTASCKNPCASVIAYLVNDSSISTFVLSGYDYDQKSATQANIVVEQVTGNFYTIHDSINSRSVTLPTDNPTYLRMILGTDVSVAGASDSKITIDQLILESKCKTSSDTNCDGTVSRTELGGAITSWTSGTLSRTELGEAISAWAGAA